MTQIACLSPSPLARVIIYMRSGTFFIFTPCVHNILLKPSSRGIHSPRIQGRYVDVRHAQFSKYKVQAYEGVT